VSRRRLGNGGLVITHEDISERERLYARIEAQNEQLDAALNNMVQGLAMFDADERVIIANRRFGEMYGMSPEEINPGTPLREIVARRIVLGLYQGHSVEDIMRVMRERLSRKTPSYLMSSLADGRSILVSIQPRAAGGWVTTHQDVTEKRRAEAQLEHLARHEFEFIVGSGARLN
jgi:PAS domain S-box-containing protein